MKILSVIIPTYNMEALLPRCLDSLVSAEGVEQLEVCVVNDGSKDHSLQVAQMYQKKYPDVVTVIDKPNGNYGSTINAALPVVKGKYVKILDSDDYFDTVALDAFINHINAIDSDVIHTIFTQLGKNGMREVVKYNTMGREPYEYGKVYELDDVLKGGYIRFFVMHALAYRTDLLRAIEYRQTEGISYTDTEWSCMPIVHARTICFLSDNVYQYNLDRDGQTMAPEVIIKSIPQIEKVNESILSYYLKWRNSCSTIRQNWFKLYFENRVRNMYKLFLLDMPRGDFHAEEMQRMDDKLSVICQQLDLHPRLYPENKILRTEYIAYWHKYHKRWPVWYERFNKGVDVIVKWLYVKFIRR